MYFEKFTPAALSAFGALLLMAGPLFCAEARLTYEDTLLTANEIVYDHEKRLAAAAGNVTATAPVARIVGDFAEYGFETRRLTGENLRFGHPPFFAQAAAIDASPELVELEGAVAYFGEPRPGALNLRAHRIRYFPDERVEAEKVTLHVGRVPVFYLPRISRRLEGGLMSEASIDAGYSRNLGGFVSVGTRTALLPGLSAGPEIGFYGQRGLLVGPGLDYRGFREDHLLEGSLRGGYIRDRGEVGLDRLDRPIDRDRFYAEWRHKQLIGDKVEITGASDIWSDSEVTRDFRSRSFATHQFPDNFLEAAYLGEGYFLSAFTRVAPNDFQTVPERLPEVRFDLPSRPLAEGIYQQSHASAAVLREDDPLGEDLRSDRLDWYYGVSRPFLLTDWLTFTPKAGGRLTHYQRALGERDDYTRLLGEVGADLEGNAFALYDYRNELWRIRDIRHVVKPRIQYRYTPKADRGREFIPQVDRRVLTPHLEPIDLGQVRNIDQLDEIHTLRYGIENVFQTRHPTYGSTDLLSLFIANDLRFSRQRGEELASDIHTQFTFTPIYWLRLDAFNRLSPQEPEIREFSTGLTVTDARFWSMRLGTEYLQDRLEEYSVFLSRRLNETYRVAAEIHYDAVENRFSRQNYTLFQNLYDSWEVRYHVFLRVGAERESPAGFALSFSYLAF